MINKYKTVARRLGMAVISIGLLTAAFLIAGTEDVFRDLARFPAWAVAGVLGLFSFNLFVVSFRLARVLTHFGIAVPGSVISKASVSGHVAGLFIMSLFGQVVGRHLVLHRYGVPSVLIASLTAYERAVLLLVSGGLCLIGAALLLDNFIIADFLAGISLAEILLASAGSVIFSLWLGRSNFEAQLISRGHSRANISNILEIASITLVAQILVLATFVISIMALQPGIDFWHLLAAAAIISFAASLPITVNGWGVRELAAVYTLGQLGIPSSSALAVSILVGLCSTTVILAAAPITLRKQESPDESSLIKRTNTMLRGLEIEKAAAWIISTAAAVLIFFQMHLALQGGVINLNLADPFAILALAAIAVHAINTRKLPNWRSAKFNSTLLVISGLLVFAFIRGALDIGITQWALAGRLMGWLVLLGYLSIGYLAVSHMGGHGLRRFAETIISSAVVVVVMQIALRWLDQHGWISELHITKNFEGYAGNRNAFAFQMLICSTLIMAYSFLYFRASRLSLLKSESANTRNALRDIKTSYRGICGNRFILFSLLHGIILAGLVFSASRAGLLAEAVLLITAWVARFADRRLILLSLAFGALIWVLPQLTFGEAFSTAGVQSTFSRESSNLERWKSIIKGIDMWLQSPLLGSGLGVFIEKSSEWFKQPLVIHSTPVWILAEFGLLGAGVFMWSFVKLARSFNKKNLMLPAYRVIAMSLLVFVIFSLVHEIFYQRIFWLVLGAALAVSGTTSSWHPSLKSEKHHA